MNRLKFLHLWSLAVGAMDACTGLLLVFAPGWVLKLLMVPEPGAGAWVFISWMGVFITAVGLSYALVLRGAREAETVWFFTSGVRLMVAVFLFWKIVDGSLAPMWGLVAISDGSVAIGQFTLLRCGWWREGRP